MTTTATTKIIPGSRIDVDGRVGTFISYIWDSHYPHRGASWNEVVYDRAWKVVFDDAPETFVRIADEDKPRVRNITPAIVDVSVAGQRRYTVEFPDGVHTVVKKGAYWFHVAPGQPMPGKKDFRGGSNTRQDAIDSALSHWRFTASKPAQAAKDARQPRWS